MIAESQQFQQLDRGARPVRIALLGCGTVGSAVARMLAGFSRKPGAEASERFFASHDVDLQLTHVFVRDVTKERSGIDASLLTDDFEQVLQAKPDVVIEALGGRDPAGAFVRRLLERGISVVSANKTMIAHEGPKLFAIAERTGARLAYEASVGAAIPVLAAIRQRAGDPIIALRAILNGTCNFVLNRMRESGRELSVILREAIEAGIAEPDPTADISGRDTAEKLCILAREAGFSTVTPADVHMRGIENITPRDLDAAREQGCVVRLIADLEAASSGQVRLRVEPMFVPIGHPLAKAEGAENVIVLDQGLAGRLTLRGEGAGPKPTAAAILGDLLHVIEARTLARSTAAAPAMAVPRRAFVRLPAGHEAEARLRTHATHVHLRRDAMECVTEEDVAGTVLRGAFIAAILR